LLGILDALLLCRRRRCIAEAPFLSAASASRIKPFTLLLSSDKPKLKVSEVCKVKMLFKIKMSVRITVVGQNNKLKVGATSEATIEIKMVQQCNSPLVVPPHYKVTGDKFCATSEQQKSLNNLLVNDFYVFY